ncbi:MAG TPA: hypothetical protein VHD60_04580 [Candidatus Saccharimonadales bacterium]|nr:hypothetical protein [Candidatus Saccharimonadales bacterium]
MKSAESTLAPPNVDELPLLAWWPDADDEKLSATPELMRMIGEEQFLQYAEYLEETHPDEEGKIYDACEVWSQIASRYDAALRAVTQLNNNETPDNYAAEGYVAWNQSKLAMLTSANGKKALTTESLVESVASGRIRTLLSEWEPFVDIIVETLEYWGISVQPGDWRPVYPLIQTQRKGESSAQSYHQLHLFSPALQTYVEQERDHSVASAIRLAFCEARNASFEGKCISGPYQERFAAARNHMLRLLAEAGIQVPFSILQPEEYSIEYERHLIRGKFSPEQQAYIAEVYTAKSDYFEEVAAATWDADRDQTIAQGLFDHPAFLPQREVMRCANAAFRMILHGLTGVKLTEAALNDAIYGAHGTTFISDVDYLKVLNTRAFTECFQKEVQCINFAAMDLATLGRIAQRAKEASYGVLGVATLGTEFAADKNVQHRVVLLNVDRDTVTMHDPSPDARAEGNARVISKQEFCRRWAGAQNSGYLVLTR